jgi:hypothetical protein
MYSTGATGNFTEFDAAIGFALVYGESFVGGFHAAVNNDASQNTWWNCIWSSSAAHGEASTPNLRHGSSHRYKVAAIAKLSLASAYVLKKFDCQATWHRLSNRKLLFCKSL